MGSARSETGPLTDHSGRPAGLTHQWITFAVDRTDVGEYRLFVALTLFWIIVLLVIATPALVRVYLRRHRTESADDMRRAGDSQANVDPAAVAESAVNRSTWMRAGGS